MIHTTRTPRATANRHAALPMAAMLAGLLTLGACASAAPPSENILAAEMAIANAEQSRAAENAAAELAEAREKLVSAKAAIKEDKMVIGSRLAEQARVDAELATAKNNAVKAMAVNAEMQKSSEILKQEMQRNTGVQQ